MNELELTARGRFVLELLTLAWFLACMVALLVTVV